MNIEFDRYLESTATEWGSSRWATWRECEAKHHNSYIVPIERLKAPKPALPDTETPGAADAEPRETYFEVGGLVHAGLAFRHDGHTDHAPLLDYASSTGRFEVGSLIEASRLLKWYFAHWGDENAGWGPDTRILGAEIPLSWDDAALPHTGRADLLVEISGSTLVVDTKTRAKGLPADPDDLAAWIRGQSLNPQFVSLSAMTQRKFDLPEPPAVMVNAIIKTKVPAFARVVVPISEQRVAMWAEVHRHSAERYLAYQEAVIRGAAPLQNWSSCVSMFGKMCYFASYCHGSEESRMLNWGPLSRKAEP